MNNIVKKLYIGHCYVCGKLIGNDEDVYGTLEGPNTLYCEKCWNEYAERCDALIEQMKKEKTSHRVNCLWGLEQKDRHCEFCTIVCPARPLNRTCINSVVLPLTIKAIMETGKDGLFCITSDIKVGNSYLGGYGLTEDDAKKDFQKSIIEAVNENVKVEYLEDSQFND